MGVLSKCSRIEVTYTVDIAISGADPVQKKFGSIVFKPDVLNLTYRETGSGWTLQSATLSGRRVLKVGYGATCSERLWSSDDWPEWVRSAVKEYAPKGTLR